MPDSPSIRRVQRACAWLAVALGVYAAVVQRHGDFFGPLAVAWIAAVWLDFDRRLPR